MKMERRDYPNLLTERTWKWGPVWTVFELERPPASLVGNVSMAPYDDSGWVIVRQDAGWGIVGGTLEPGETSLETIRRELIEEAGCDTLAAAIRDR